MGLDNRNERGVRETIGPVVEKAIAERVFPGCVVGVVTADGQRSVFPFGRQTYESDSPLVVEDTVYDVASVTKAIPVSCAALKALEQGRIGLEERLIDWVPEYCAPHADRITLRHLLTQTLDHAVRLSALKQLAAGDLLSSILRSGLHSEPGTVFAYANATSILLGLMVERVFGAPLAVVARDLFFEPLGMVDTTFEPERLAVDRIAPTEQDPWRGGEVRGVVHDESAYVLRSIMTPGSAGLFSTAGDLLRFLEVLLQSGVGAEGGVFRRETVEMMCTNQVAHLGASAGLGWELGRREYMGEVCSARTIGKTGFTGCVVMCDPFGSRTGLVVLSNHTWPRRHDSRATIGRVRRGIADVVFGGASSFG